MGKLWDGVKKIGKNALTLIPGSEIVTGPPEVGAKAATKDGAKIAAGADATAAAAAGEHEGAKGRVTTAGNIQSQTAGPVKVGSAGTVTGETVGNVGRTRSTGVGGPDGSAVRDVQTTDVAASKVAAPTEIDDLGRRIKGAEEAQQAGRQRVQVSDQGRALQGQAAAHMQQVLSGNVAGAAELKLAAEQDRARAEQLSIAAGARGGSVAAARRNAAANISLQDVEFGGKAAELKAQQIAEAAQGLLSAGGQIRGQDIDVGKTQAQLDQGVELENAKARNDMIAAAQERFARGELSEAQFKVEIAKADAEFVQRSREKTVDNRQRAGESNQGKDLKLTEMEQAAKTETARQQLEADIASDTRLQAVFTREAELRQQAAIGNRDAAVELDKHQATIDAEMGRFNAEQIQTANSKNIENRLRAMELDDNFVTQTRDAWLRAEQSGDTAALEALKIKVEATASQAKSKEDWKKDTRKQIKDSAEAAAKMYAASDVRTKRDIEGVDPGDVDGFLRSVRETSEWEYKNPEKHGEGRRIGPMAQTMAADKLGRRAVKQDEDGTLMLDFQQLGALNLAAAGRLAERLEDVEGFLKAHGAKPRNDEREFLRAHGRR